MVAEIYGGISAFKAALDIAKGLKDIDDATRRNAAIINLQEQILSAQQAQMALVETIGKLQKEVASFEAWDREKLNYELQKVGIEGFAFALKESERGGEPPHHICANCFHHRRVSLLMYGSNEKGRAVLRCFQCPTEVRLPVKPISQEVLNKSARPPSRGDWMDR